MSSLKPLDFYPFRTHTRIRCLRCGRKRDRGYLRKMNICRVCFRTLAPRWGFYKY